MENWYNLQSDIKESAPKLQLDWRSCLVYVYASGRSSPSLCGENGEIFRTFYGHTVFFPCRRFMGVFLTQSPVLTQALLRMLSSPKPSCPGSPSPLSSVLRPGRDTSSQTWRSRSKSPQTFMELFSGPRYAQVPMCHLFSICGQLTATTALTQPNSVHSPPKTGHGVVPFPGNQPG